MQWISEDSVIFIETRGLKPIINFASTVLFKKNFHCNELKRQCNFIETRILKSVKNDIFSILLKTFIVTNLRRQCNFIEIRVLKQIKMILLPVYEKKH